MIYPSDCYVSRKTYQITMNFEQDFFPEKFGDRFTKTI